MAKYYVRMNYVVAYSTEFLIDGSDDEVIDGVLSSMNNDFLEENLKWSVSDYEEPIIENFRISESKDRNVPEVSSKFYKEFDKIRKSIYEVD